MENIEHTVDRDALIARVEQLIRHGGSRGTRPLLASSQIIVPASLSLAERFALSDGAFDTTEVELDQALRAAPGDPGLRKCRAELRRQHGDLEGAVRDAAEAVMLDRTTPSYKALLGDLLSAIGRSDDAVACLSEALVAMPRDIYCRQKLSDALVGIGNLDGAVQVLLDGIAVVPAATATRNAAIVLCIRRRDFVLADKLSEQARIDGVADASTFGLRGHALSSLGRHDEATVAYNDALRLAPDDSDVRQLAASAGGASKNGKASREHVGALFDHYADRFDAHLVDLGYRVPAVIRRHVIDYATVANIGPVLDLGCGTGLVAVALSDLALGPFTGIDLSARMLDEARVKGLYETLLQARLPDALWDETARWKLILAADVLCYFGALEKMLDIVRGRLRPGGRFIFSVEELLPNHDGTVPGNGDWALGRQGRYAHAAAYVARLADSRDLHCIALEREILRFEAGGPVQGLIMVLERPRDDA
jgi:predicted TPR repeat methyltransferase